ncbi:MAG: sulfite exporter TauE/SafE family protein [Saprospirales bacterium]|nr:sulfite exporter TauE/SafE family protein [Saprospirales bacterium]
MGKDIDENTTFASARNTLPGFDKRKEQLPIEVIILFFAIALVYASAGFGGGSSYLALLALLGLPVDALRPAALLCNLVVVSGNMWVFWRTGLFNWKKTLPIVLAGIPMAFLGGFWPLGERSFFILLGGSLVMAALAMSAQNWWRTPEPPEIRQLALPPAIGLGGGLGLLAGLTGIGGGIFLAPVLHLLRWGPAKSIAAAASLFIFCQSAAGLGGWLTRHAAVDWALTLPLLVAVGAGGQLGVRWSAGWFSQKVVRNLTAVLVFYAGVNMLWRYL